MKKQFTSFIRACLLAFTMLLPYTLNASVSTNISSVYFADENKEMAKFLLVWDKQGGTVAFPLKERPRIVTDVELGVIRCITTKEEVSFSISDVHKYTLDANSVDSSIDELLSDEEGGFHRTNNTLEFENFPSDMNVSVYNIEGLLIKSYTTDNTGSLSISMEGWTTGVYLIKAGSVTYKIAKR